MKKAKPLIILCAVLAALIISLAVIRIVQNSNAEKAQQQAQAEIIHVGSIDSASLIEFTDKDGQQLTFVLDGDEWKYQQDADFPVKQTYVTRIADLVNGCTASRAFENADLSEYGLDTPANTLYVQDSGGQSLTLDISEKKGDVCYAGDGSGTVYVVDTNFISYTSYGLMDFIQTDTFTQVQENEISEVVISGEGRTLTLTAKSGRYTDDTSWYVTQDGQQVKTDEITLPGESSATAVVKNAVNVLSSYRSSSVVDYNPDEAAAAEYGLDNPVSVSVSYTDSDTQQDGEFTLLIGTANGDGLRYFTIPGSNLVYTLSDSFALPVMTALEQMGQ